MTKQSNAADVIRFDYSLEELFYPEELAEKMEIARRRVVTTFITATEPVPTSRIKWHQLVPNPDGSARRKPRRGTDNYIIGVGSKQKDLAAHIVKTARKPIIRPCDLPESIRRHAHMVERVISAAEHRIVLALLNEMCSAPLSEIYYDEACGIWQIVQSCIDQHKRSLRQARQALKFDRRNEHGMIRSQRINRGRPAGVSTSLAESAAYL